MGRSRIKSKPELNSPKVTLSSYPYVLSFNLDSFPTLSQIADRKSMKRNVAWKNEQYCEESPHHRIHMDHPEACFSTPLNHRACCWESKNTKYQYSFDVLHEIREKMFAASQNNCHCQRLRPMAEHCTCDLKDFYNDRWLYRGHQLNQSLRSFSNHCHCGCVKQPPHYLHSDQNETTRDLADIQYSQKQYYPTAIDHSKARISPRSPRSVTMLPRSSTPTNGCWDKLSFSIWQRFTAIKQTEKTFLQKMNLWGHLYECVQKIPRLPKFELFLMGSTISGFGMEGSDIDMCVVAKDGPLYCDLRTEALENLLHVKQFLDRMPSTNLEQISLICAMVPILRLKHKPDDFDIEISFNNYVGIRNTQLLHCYAQLDWRVRPLVIIVKLWAKHNNLNDPKNCTLSSYSLALMVINFLQCGVSPPVLPCLHELYPEKFSGPVNTDRLKLFERVEAFSTYNDDTLSSLFVNFLKYYTKFDYKNYALSVRTGTIIPAKECAWKSKTSIRDEGHCYLSIEEPFNRTNTAKSVHNGYVFEQIKYALAASWRTLEDTQDLNDIFAEPLFSTPTLSPLTNSSSF